MILTKTDIKFNDLVIRRETNFNLATAKNETKYFVNVGYVVQTQEGEEYAKEKRIELTGAKLTTVKSFFDTIYNQIKGEEV